MSCLFASLVFCYREVKFEDIELQFISQTRRTKNKTTYEHVVSVVCPLKVFSQLFDIVNMPATNV